MNEMIKDVTEDLRFGKGNLSAENCPVLRRMMMALPSTRNFPMLVRFAFGISSSISLRKGSSACSNLATVRRANELSSFAFWRMPLRAPSATLRNYES